MPTFIRVDSLQVHGMSNYVIFIRDAVSSQHVSGLPGNIQCFSTAVPLEHGNHFRCRSVMAKNLFTREESGLGGRYSRELRPKLKEENSLLLIN